MVNIDSGIDFKEEMHNYILCSILIEALAKDPTLVVSFLGRYLKDNFMLASPPCSFIT